MNAENQKFAVIGAVVLAVVGAGYLAWGALFEKAWVGREKIHDDVRTNYMYVAGELLRQRGHTVTTSGSLGEQRLDTLPDGTLILAYGAGVLPEDQAGQLLAWVRRGNTVLYQPRTLGDDEEAADESGEEAVDDTAAQITEAVQAAEGAEDAEGEQTDDAAPAPEDADAQAEPDPHAGHAHAQGGQSPAGSGEETDNEDAEDEDVVLKPYLETDPIAARFGVRRSYLPPGKCDKQAGAARKAPPRRCGWPLRMLTPPDTSHRLEIDADGDILVAVDTPGASAPLFTDADASTVRVYREGQGKVVMLSGNFFGNRDLRLRDHAELLLLLTSLDPARKHVTIVERLNVQPWWQALWERFDMLLTGIAAFLALLAWAAVRRFGPTLLAPSSERRSLMEHIDASGAWLWKVDGGRQLLLDTVRADTLQTILRRAPGLARLESDALAGELAALCKLSEQHVREALQQDAGDLPHLFTRQIRTLQTLRNHHER